MRESFNQRRSSRECIKRTSGRILSSSRIRILRNTYVNSWPSREPPKWLLGIESETQDLATVGAICSMEPQGKALW